MWFRHTRTRLVTAGAAFAALTAVVPVACAALDDPPSVPAQRSPARAMGPFGSGHACAQTRLVLGSARPDGTPAGREGWFRAFRGEPPLGRPDMRTVPDGTRWWGAPGAPPHRHPRALVLAPPGSEARSRGTPGADVHHTHGRWHGHRPVTRPDEPAPTGFR